MSFKEDEMNRGDFVQLIWEVIPGIKEEDYPFKKTGDGEKQRAVELKAMKVMGISAVG